MEKPEILGGSLKHPANAPMSPVQKAIASARPYASLRCLKSSSTRNIKRMMAGKTDGLPGRLAGKTAAGVAVAILTTTCGYEFSFENRIPEPEIEWLSTRGRGGAIAGIIVRAGHQIVSCNFWLDWRHAGERNIDWQDERMIFVGTAEDNNMDLSSILAPSK